MQTNPQLLPIHRIKMYRFNCTHRVLSASLGRISSYPGRPSTSTLSSLNPNVNNDLLHDREVNNDFDRDHDLDLDIDEHPRQFAPNNNDITRHVRPKTIAWKDAKPYEMIPGPKPFPGIGNTWRFLWGEFQGMDPLGIQKSLYDSYGTICRLTNIVGRPDTVFMFDPNFIHEMYCQENHWPIREVLKVMTHYRKVYKKDVFSEGIGLPVSQGEEWGKLRTQVNPILMQPRITSQFIPKIESAARGFIRRIDNLARVNPLMQNDFLDEIHKYTLESVSYVSINRRFGLMDDELSPEIRQIITSTVKVFDLIYELDMQTSLWKIIPTPKWREFIHHMDFLTYMYMKLIEEEINNLMQKTSFKSEEDRSILQKFLEVDKNVAITVVFDVMGAGVDTTSKTLAALLYLVAKHKRVQEKLRKELFEIIPDINTPLTPQLLNECKYLRAVIKESIRIHCVSLGNIRTADRDLIIGGYQIPKGVELVGGHFVMCNSDEWIPRAAEFLPERFLREDANTELSMRNFDKYLYLPFGVGPRSCIGKRLANLELEVSVAMILRKFRLDWQQPDMRFRSTIMYGLIDPLKLHVYPLEEGDEKKVWYDGDLDRLDYTPEASI